MPNSHWSQCWVTLMAKSSNDFVGRELYLQILCLSQSALEAQKKAPNPREPSCSPAHNTVQSGGRHTKANMWSSYHPSSLRNTGITKASSTLHPENSFLCLYIRQPLTPGACWLRQIGKLSAAECLLECFLIISGKYGLCIIINWTKHWRSVSQVPVNGAINSQRREVYSIWKLSFSIHLHSSPKVLSSGLLLSITLIRLIPS